MSTTKILGGTIVFNTDLLKVCLFQYDLVSLTFKIILPFNGNWPFGMTPFSFLNSQSKQMVLGVLGGFKYVF